MKYIALVSLFTFITTLSFSKIVDLVDIESTLMNLQNKANEFKAITPLAPTNKDVFYKLLRSEIEKSLKNKNTKNFNIIKDQSQSVITAKAIIKNFYPNGLDPSDNQFQMIANYILLTSLITEFFKENNFPLKRTISILSINGMVNPETYAMLFFALDQASFESISLTILGHIDDINDVNKLKELIAKARKKGILSIQSPDIKYYKTISELLKDEHKIDLYLYNLRATPEYLESATPNSIDCIRQNPKSVLSMYFPDILKSIFGPINPEKFLISFSGTIPVDLMTTLGTVTSPSKIDVLNYECKPIKDEAIDVFNLIYKTKTKNTVPLFCYNYNNIKLIQLPTNDAVSSIGLIIKTRGEIITTFSPSLSLYKWNITTSKFNKFKDI